MNTLPPPPPLKVYRYMLRGLEQQMWFWGQDVRRGGNLLLRYGFEKFRSGKAGSSRYRVEWSRGVTIEVHSFCAGLYRQSAPGFCYIRGRSNGYLFESPEPPDPECFCHAPLKVPNTAEEQALFNSTAGAFLEWVEEYEGWLEKLVGPSYRQSLHPHAPLPWLPPGESRRWFADYCRDPLRTTIPRRHQHSMKAGQSHLLFRASRSRLPSLKTALQS